MLMTNVATLLTALLAGLFVVLISLAPPASPAAAQTRPTDSGHRNLTVEGPASAGPAPEVGEVVLDDPLTGPAALWANTCVTRHGLRQFVGEGLLFKITGRCSEQATAAQVTTRLTRLLVPDGEIRLEAKVLSGAQRTALRLWVRDQSGDDPNYYFVEVQPGVGRARLDRTATLKADPAARHPDRQAMLASANVRSDTLAERTDLAAMFIPDGWNTIAIRLQGPKMWLLVNDQVALSTMDATHTTGAVYLGVARLGAIDDTVEAGLLLRNLHVSRLAQTEPGNEPIYLQPPTPGAVVTENPLTGSGILRAGVCATERNRMGFVTEGFEMRATGRCHDTSTVAYISTPLLKGLTLPDGEVRFDLKSTGEPDRALFRFFFRADADVNNGYAVNLAPGRGQASLYRWTNGQPTFITGREDLTWLFQPTDWNTVAVRVRGEQLWLLLNGQAVLFAADGAHGMGGTAFDLIRLGNLDDQQEVKAVIRNLRVSTLLD